MNKYLMFDLTAQCSMQAAMKKKRKRKGKISRQGDKNEYPGAQMPGILSKVPLACNF